MSTELESKLLSVITESLPAAHVGVLREYLLKAQKTEQEISELNRKFERVNLEKEKLSQSVRELSELNHKLQLRIAEFEKRENDLRERELTLDKKVLEVQLQSMTNERNTVERLAASAFRNPTFLKTNTDTKSISGHQGPSGWVNDHYETTTKTEKLEQE